jgi:hypothetical protein
MELEGAFTALLDKDTVKDVPWSVSYGIGRNLSRLRVLNTETRDQQERVNKQLRDLALEHCDKDDGGKPITTGDSYSGLTYGAHPTYDAAVQGIAAGNKTYMREEVEFEEYHIKGVPPKGTAMWALVCEFFEEPTEAK